MSPPEPYPTDSQPAVTCFSVETEAEPALLARVIEVFALRSVMPERFQSVHGPAPSGAARAVLNVDIAVVGLAPCAAQAIARKLAAVVGVRSVLTDPATG